MWIYDKIKFSKLLQWFGSINMFIILSLINKLWDVKDLINLMKAQKWSIQMSN